MIRLLRDLLDARDLARSRRLRAAYGRRRWLISWERRPDGRWAARLSCPDRPETVVRHGTTRCRAACAADRALRRLLLDDEETDGD